MKKALSLLMATLLMISALAFTPVTAETATQTQNTVPDIEETVGYSPDRVLEVSGLTEKVTASTAGVIQIPSTDTEGNNFVLTENGKYVINNVDQLKQFGRILRLTAKKDNHKNFAGATIYITTNLDCSAVGGNYIYGMGKNDTDCHFSGTLDGQGYVISNYAFLGNGFISRAQGATIKNLVLVNCGAANTTATFGGLVGLARVSTVTVDNCMVKADLTATGTDDSNIGIGGIIGRGADQPMIIRNSTFEGSVTGVNRVGGILGYSAKGATISNCLNLGDVTATSTTSNVGKSAAGGILGYVVTTTATIDGCVNVGKVTSLRAAGTFVGTAAQGAATVVNISNSYNYGTFSVSSQGETAHHARGQYSRIYGECFYSMSTGATLTIDGVRYYGAYGPNTDGTTIYTGIPDMDLTYKADGTRRVGGAVRITPTLPMGLRFTSVIPAAMIADVRSKADAGTEISYGTIIAPADYVTGGMLLTAGALSKAGKTYLDIKGNVGMETDENGNVRLRAAIARIQTENLGRDYLSVPYISYVKNGKTVYKYVYQVGARNAYDIATLALAAGDYKTTDEYNFMKQQYIDAYDALS